MVSGHFKQIKHATGLSWVAWFSSLSRFISEVEVTVNKYSDWFLSTISSECKNRSVAQNFDFLTFEIKEKHNFVFIAVTSSWLKMQWSLKGVISTTEANILHLMSTELYLCTQKIQTFNFSLL